MKKFIFGLVFLPLFYMCGEPTTDSSNSPQECDCEFFEYTDYEVLENCPSEGYICVLMQYNYCDYISVEIYGGALKSSELERLSCSALEKIRENNKNRQ